jgi:hypothetical protein
MEVQKNGEKESCKKENGDEEESQEEKEMKRQIVRT